MAWIIEDNLDPTLQDWGEAYKELCAIIKAKLPEVKHIDLYYGQDQFVEQDGNWNPFPCPAVLLGFRAAQVRDLGDNTQELHMDITMYLYMETVQDTHHGSAGQRRAMEFVKLMRKLHQTMHGASGEHFSPLSRVDMAQKTDAPPYAYVFGQTYRCVLLDNSGSRQWDFSEPNSLGLEIEQYAAPPVDDRLVVVRNSDGSYSVEVAAPGMHLLPDVTHTDSDGQPVVRPAMVPFVATPPPPCAPGTVNITDHLGTSIASGTAPSGGSVQVTIPPSIITRPDGTANINLPATQPLDVRLLRAGTLYALNETLWSGQVTAYQYGDEGTFYATLQYRMPEPPYPAQTARLGANWTTLYGLNKWGDNRRFTDRAGDNTYADRIIHDHLTNLYWWRPDTIPTNTWTNAINAAQSAVVANLSDWWLPPFPVLRTIANAQGNIKLNYAPFGITDTPMLTSTTATGQTSTAIVLHNVGAWATANKTTPAPYILCRHAEP